MKDRGLIGRHRIYSGGRTAQVATERVAYSPDRLYAWQGRADRPTRQWRQESLDTETDFYRRVRRNLAGKA